LQSFDASYLPGRADRVVIDRLLSGRMHVKDARTEDRDAAILMLTAEGAEPGSVANRLKCSTETVRMVVDQAAARRARLDRLAVHA
jgi:hypothetical protein